MIILGIVTIFAILVVVGLAYDWARDQRQVEEEEKKEYQDSYYD